MQCKNLRRYLAISLIGISFALAPASWTKSQDRRVAQATSLELPVAQSACPRPISLTLTAANPPNVFAGDFAPVQLTSPVGLNFTGPDKAFLYTFQWRREQGCCQITKAVLTVKMRSNLPGQSKTDHAAGNDAIYIMHAGQSVYGEPVYSQWPFPVNHPTVKQWTLSPAVLNNINTFGRLSLYLQDDTRVESATLQLTGCCLSTPPKGTTEAASPNQ